MYSRKMAEASSWAKYVIMYRHVEALRVKDKRFIFQKMRTVDGMDHDTYFPCYGITAGEFAVWQILSERKSEKKSKKGGGVPPC